MSDRPPYDHRNCQSLFGYSAAVHVRSGGTCELCGAGDSADFDFWRQLTVEHLIGESQGGYLPSIKKALVAKFSALAPAEAASLAVRLDAINTVTACSFCNATTSRTRTDVSMSELIEAAETTESLVSTVAEACAAILASKRAHVAWKLEAMRLAWEETVAPAHQRGGDGRLHLAIEPANGGLPSARQ